MQTVMWSRSITTVVFLIVVQLVHQGCGVFNTKDYIIESDRLPEVRFRPPIGNGHVATNVLSDTVYMNGLYNGREDRSSRARLPAHVSIDIASSKQFLFQRQYVLDMFNGLFVQKMLSTSVNVEITYFAHRTSTRLLVTQITVRRNNDVTGDITLNVTSYQGDDSKDFKWQLPRNVTVQGQLSSYLTGTITEPEVDNMTSTSIHVYHTVLPRTITLQAIQSKLTVSFVASYSMQHEDALDSYKAALSDVVNDAIIQSHQQSWKSLWTEGRIDIQGNPDLSTNIAAATYNILCSLPSQDDPVTPFFGLGPGGLSRGGLLMPEKPGGPRNDYAGHVFWDMDTWIMPPVMMFHPGMARRMIGARTRVLDQVRENARKNGRRGIKVPWEQASTGIEVTPKWAGNMSLYQIHITADVSYALRQYIYAVDDVTILTEGRGFELAFDIARFWQSRVTNTDKNTVEILGVMGPDEYHANINNSVYTNYNAKLSLLLPQYLCGKYEIEVNETLQEEMNQFADTAKKILVLFDETLNYHPQYEDFDLNVTIKQSDVVLLGYPLMMNMSRDVRRNDLELYEKITNPNGPDTGTWSMHTVGWLELGDLNRAQENFKMMFRNINEPFKVFSEKPVTETAYGGCVNFITGAGGLLQSVVFGYGGLRLHPDRLDLNPNLLPNTTSWSLTGVHYKRATFDVNITDDDVIVTVITKPVSTYVTITTELQHSSKRLTVNEPYRFKRGMSSIHVDSTDLTDPVSRHTSHQQDSTPFSIVTEPRAETTTSNAPIKQFAQCTLIFNAVILFLYKSLM